MFALQSAHLPHPDYFLACITHRPKIDPVLLTDKRRLLPVLSLEPPALAAATPAIAAATPALAAATPMDNPYG